MELEGRLWKSKQFWLIEIPALDAMTQGRNRKEAIEMAKDLITEMVVNYFPDRLDDSFKIAINDYKRGVIGVTTTSNSLMLALSLRRQREKSGSSVRQASARLGSAYPNAYAQYERGRTRISLDQYERLLLAANPHKPPHLRISA